MKIIDDGIRRLEKDRIKNNIVITGAKIEADNSTDLKHGLEHVIETGEKHIKEAIKIGTKIYKAELENALNEEKIMKNKNKLKQLQERIYINNEMTKEEWEIQKKLRQRAEEERKNERITKIEYQKIITDGRK
ncbi:hypothetical protein ILUMI_08065 [Ignelater luminosus]|uniref:Uncharacterized protein n=1 Tax=Ignelater luminosus TaxID=2038154 RepID=A0A8K0GB06_IGNLU|nr:hypothetical protein ILUMI_08065 [Ignelater luminosus]